MNAPPASCDYETAAGGACGRRAAVKLVIRQIDAPASLSGEPVKYTAHACKDHAEKAVARLPAGLRVETLERL